MFIQVYKLTAILLFLLNSNIFATPPLAAITDTISTPAEESSRIAPDDPIVAMFDSLALLNIFTNIEKRASVPGHPNPFPAGFVPEYSDEVYSERFKRLNEYSTIEFVYNPAVKGFIGLYAFRRRDLTERVLGLAQLYFPLFEEQLDKYNLPLELKYLAVIESALNPIARSRVGATGLWQFMYGTGKMYGLQVNSMVDDRSDIFRSTVAACEHFVDLFRIYGDWNLVLCAYNAGPGNVNRAIRRAGGARDFWAIRQFLPTETRNYVPAFMAVAYVMEHARDHNLYPNPPVYSHFDVDTIKVTRSLNLNTVSQFLNIPIDHLRFLNPAFRHNIIPFNEKNPYVLRLPRDYTGKFISNAETIYNHRSAEQQRQEILIAQVPETVSHTVRQGETLSAISKRYGTSVAEIQRMNNIRGTNIRVGQRLTVKGGGPAARTSGGAFTGSVIASNTNTHVVKTAETLGVIAARYSVSVNELLQWNNLSNSTIHPGQNLIVRRPANFISSNVTAAADESMMDEDEDSGSFLFYTVQQGDTLYDIAKRFDNVTVEDLKEINNLTSESNLPPGLVLRINTELPTE
jgi:membrane-bound lytic murein transglycosylase D